MEAAIVVLEAISVRDASAMLFTASFADTATWDRSLFGTMATVATIFSMPPVPAVPVNFLFAAAMMLAVDQFVQQID